MKIYTVLKSDQFKTFINFLISQWYDWFVKRMCIGGRFEKKKIV